MAHFLADRDIRSLIPDIIIDGSKDLVDPNGIKLRLGNKVLFHSTGEEKDLKQGDFLKVGPGETVSISSLEKIDFSKNAVDPVLPGRMLMGFITPTTTMMREGISQVATKIDAGFRGQLNWALRNGSTRNLKIAYGEPIFKLTILALNESESPDEPYGAGDDDHYQDTAGIMRSKRQIPADIPPDRIIESSREKADPKKHLQQAGYPFNHIGTELTQLHGKFEVVQTSVNAIQTRFDEKIKELSDKIDRDAKTILYRFDSLFDSKFNNIVWILIGAIIILYGALSFLEEDMGYPQISIIALVVGISILLINGIKKRRDRAASELS